MFESCQVLHPRQTGFDHICTNLENLQLTNDVYDITVGYPENLVHQETELLFKGRFPNTICFHVKKHKLSDIKKIGYGKWVDEAFKAKEQNLKEFYESRQEFNGEILNSEVDFLSAYWSIFKWTCIFSGYVYTTVTFSSYFYFQLISGAIFAVITKFKGVDRVLIDTVLNK